MSLTYRPMRRTSIDETKHLMRKCNDIWHCLNKGEYAYGAHHVVSSKNNKTSPTTTNGNAQALIYNVNSK